MKQQQPFVAAMLLLFLKALLFRYFVFDGVAWSQVAADLASIMFLAGLIDAVSPARFKKFTLWSLNLLISFLLFAATVYYNYFSTIPTLSAFSELRQVGGVKESVFDSIQTRNLLFFVDLVALAAGWFILRLLGRTRIQQDRNDLISVRVWRFGVIGAAVVGLIVSQLYIWHAAKIENELAHAEEVGFINYQVSALMNSYKKPAIELDLTDLLIEDEPIDDLDQVPPIVGFGTATGSNLIIIQMEAFQNFPIHLKLNGQTLTPTLNELADNGYYFPRVFQQIGRGNTSDAEFISNTSIFPMRTVAMSTGFGDRVIPSLPRLLHSRGYAAETFHVNDVMFWDRNKLYPALGFDHYYDRPYFEDDKFNGFGASDEQLYKFAMKRMVELKQTDTPFYVQLVTVSSHHPFRIPVSKRVLDLPDNIEGTQLGHYLQAIHYTDYAIGELIRMLKEEDLYDNTMIVLYGDHFGLQTKDNDPADVSAKLGIHYHDSISRFNIPLIIHVPGEKPQEVIRTVGGQMDIMPTIANLLGISLKEEGFIAFGQDLFNIEKNIIGLRYHMPTGSFFNNDIMFMPGKSFEDGTAVSLETHEPVLDFDKYRDDYDHIMQLMKTSDAYVETLPKR